MFLDLVEDLGCKVSKVSISWGKFFEIFVRIDICVAKDNDSISLSDRVLEEGYWLEDNF